MSKLSSKFLCSVIVCSIFAFGMHAQTGAGRIRGSIKDPTNAVIPGAQVTAVQIETGLEYKSQANAAGLYVFPSLQPGRYRLTAASAGMQNWRGEVALPTGETAVVDITLKIGTTHAGRLGGVHARRRGHVQRPHGHQPGPHAGAGHGGRVPRGEQ